MGVDEGEYYTNVQVIWRESKLNFAHRFDKYLDPNFFQHRVRRCAVVLKVYFIVFVVSDSLVLHFQLLHDGDLPGGASEHDSHEDTEKGLC